MCYGLEFWGNASDSATVFALQKRAIRIVTKSRYDEHCRNVFKQLEILTMYDLYVQKLAMFVRKNHNSENAGVHGHNTRHKALVRQRPHTHASFQRGMQFSSINVYNKLPIDVKQAPTDGIFRRRLTEWLKGQTFYDLAYFKVII